jgi:hypothetical protein
MWTYILLYIQHTIAYTQQLMPGPKVYKQFHIETMRATQLKSFCDFVNVAYKKLLQHENVRFVFLPAKIERILHVSKTKGLLLMETMSENQGGCLKIQAGKCSCNFFETNFICLSYNHYYCNKSGLHTKEI